MSSTHLGGTSTTLRFLAVGAVVIALGLLSWVPASGGERPVGAAADDGSAGLAGDALLDGAVLASEETLTEVIDLTGLSFRGVLSRDPFESIRPEPEPEPDPDPGPGPDPSDPSDPGQPGDPSDPGQPGDPSDPVQPGDPSARCRVSGNEAVCDGVVVTLTELRGNEATVQVDATRFEVEVGMTFASSFELRSVTTSCATVRYLYLGGTEDVTLCLGGAGSK